MELLTFVLFAFCIIIAINFGFLAVYCRIQRKADCVLKTTQEGTGQESTDKGTNSAKRSGFLIFLKKVYWEIMPYAYGWMRYNIIQVGKIPSHRIRNLLMRYVFCMNITQNTVIYGGCEIRSPWNIKADRCVISTYCILDGRNGIEFGQDVVLGSGVHIWTEEHSVNDPEFRVLEENRKPVTIGSRAWICSDSTLLPGVHVGEGAVIASRAVLTKDAEPYCVYGGVPAKKLHSRNENLTYQLNGKPTWHFY